MNTDPIVIESIPSDTLSNPCQANCEFDDSSDVRLLIHGGAWDIPAVLHEAHARGVRDAWEAAMDARRHGADGLRIVLSALEVLERDPTFDAGRGSFLNECGEVELDAGIMEGESLRAGAVAGIRNFLHPSQIAFDVMEKTNHAFLIGAGAEQFALACGHESLPAEELVDPREREVFARWLNAGKPDAKVFFAAPVNQSVRSGPEPEKRGTVGVVVALRNREASSGRWSLFSGTSTGGTPGKMQGRVGDVPVIGAGVYADDEGAAVSCTGWGEGLLRIAAGQRVSAAVRAGMPVSKAVNQTLADLWRRMDGRAGIIAVDGLGNMAAAFSTPYMAFAGPAGVALHLQRAGGCATVRRQDP
ncbi:MAG: isoaspartyl peptidase/L-asparaginase family protein [Silvanigrellaceae bacterium]